MTGKILDIIDPNFGVADDDICYTFNKTSRLNYKILKRYLYFGIIEKMLFFGQTSCRQNGRFSGESMGDIRFSFKVWQEGTGAIG